jgi:hypothetical protein
MSIREIWYLLYDGDSPDGRGIPSYIGRTLDRNIAWAHHEKCKSPYSTGRVKIITDTQEKQRKIRIFDNRHI